jgi:hypothetical protein
VWPWCGLGVALVWLWCGFGVALVWLCTPESMPSICLLYGFAVALGGLRPFLVQGSKFEVRRSTFSFRPRWAQSSPRRVSGETPLSLPGSQRRFGLCNWACSAPPVTSQACRHELRIERRLGGQPDGMGAVARGSGVGPGAVPCGLCKALTASHLRR